MTSECFFECGNQSENLITSGARRIRSIIAASHQRGDYLHEELQVHLDEDLTFTIKYHKSCVSSYTSRTHTQRQVVGVKRRLKREPPPLKRLCCSESSLFVFKLHCIFCGEIVVLNLTHTAHPGGELHIFVKQQAMALDCHSKIQSLKSVVDGKMHGQTKLK